MTLHSMTGYAIAQHETPIGMAVLEIRSVNSRFLDQQFRVSEELRVGEGIVREMINSQLSRGKLDCRLYLHRTSPVNTSLQLNNAVIEQLAQLSSTLQAHMPQAQALRVSEILQWPGVLQDQNLSTEQVQDLCKNLAQQGLRQLCSARTREGEKIKIMILERVAAMEAIVCALIPQIPALIQGHQQKLIEHLQSALNLALPNNPNPIISHEETATRLRQEVTLYGLRIDVAEELSRISAHLTEVRHILDKRGPCGKRLDFMMQELNREANTLGSKSTVLEQSRAAIELKLLIEQIREQVQNLE